MSGRSLRRWSIAALLSLVALAAGIPAAPATQHETMGGMLGGPPMADAQTAAKCTSVSCQQASSPEFATVSKLERTPTRAFLTAGGMTLYVLDGVFQDCTAGACRVEKMPEGPNVSVCTDASCVRTWPPFLSPSGGLKGDAATGRTLGTFTRSDGLQQVSYSGRPLYFCACDQGPGDVNGFGVTDIWGTWSLAETHLPIPVAWLWR